MLFRNQNFQKKQVIFIVALAAFVSLFFTGSSQAAPTSTILNPTNGSIYLNTDIIVFNGSGKSGTSVLTGTSLVWYSSLDGRLVDVSSADDYGTTIATTLTAGTHTITLVVTDSSGDTMTSSISLTIENAGASKLTVDILSPSNGTAFTSTDVIILNGFGFIGDGTLMADTYLSWYSSKDGYLGTGSLLLLNPNDTSGSALSDGTHVLTLVADDGAITTLPPMSKSVTVTVGSNQAPTATIIYPKDKDTIEAGASINLTGFGTDNDEGVLPDAYLTWISDNMGNLGTGSTQTVTLTPGSHKITLTAVDSDGARGSSSVNVTVNDPLLPEASIIYPSNNATFDYGAIINLLGIGYQADGDVISDANDLAWYSSKEGLLSSGSSYNFTPTETGAHVITFTAKDSSTTTPTSASKSISITVGSRPTPTAQIVYPTNNTSFQGGATIELTGVGRDTDGSIIAVANDLVWYSSRDGLLGTGSTLTLPTTISTGSHTITFVVTSPLNDTSSSTSITITVGQAPAPTVEIVYPQDGSTFNGSATISASATAKDIDGTVITTAANLIWYSDKDGQLATGSTATFTTLSVGTHKITFTAKSPTNNVSTSKTITITLTEKAQPTATIIYPKSGSVFNTSATITFVGVGLDTAGAVIPDADLKWYSSIDGELDDATSGVNEGQTVTPTALSEGTHLITFTATANNITTSATVTINIQSTPPTVKIVLPADQSSFGLNETIEFEGVAIDKEDGTMSGSSMVWTSNRVSGSNIGTGTSFSRTLITGVHIITLTATDTNGDSSSDSIAITVGDTPFNNSPTSIIRGPADGAVYGMTDTVQFQGMGLDAEDDSNDLTLSWESSIDGAIGTGTNVSTTTLSEGTHTISLTVTDTNNASTSSHIAITIQNTPPEAVIQRPLDGSSFALDQSITLQGFGSDSEDGTITGAYLTWTSSIDGVLGSGSPLSVTLSKGTHTITLSVTDDNNETSEKSVAVTVGADITNSSPIAVIQTPFDGSTFKTGQSITFTGSAIDLEDESNDLVLTWKSSKDGVLGTGSPLTKTLSDGIHSITMTAMDTGNETGEYSIAITVGGSLSNKAPLVFIQKPADGSSFMLDDDISFIGQAQDPEDGTLTGTSLTWTSSINGSLGTGTSLTTSNLSEGIHSITLTAKDSNATTSKASIAISVGGSISNTAPVAVIQKPADGTAFGVNDTIIFKGLGMDLEEDPSDLTLTWTSSKDGVIGTGTQLSAALTEGTHAIILTATDGNKATGQASIAVTVGGAIANNPPIAVIQRPFDGGTYKAGEEITFKGVGIDLEDDPSDLTLLWTSSIDGTLGNTTTFNKALTKGTHVITLTVTDSYGAIDKHAIALSIGGSVTGSAPVVAINSPIEGDTYVNNDFVIFNGGATDGSGDSIVGQSLSWTSSVDGAIGNGTFFIRKMTTGTHKITLSATDINGVTSVKTINITVKSQSFEGGNTAPTATINSPENGATFDKSDYIIFNGLGTDAEDGTLPESSLTWISNLDGQIGTGTFFSLNSLSTGNHTITFTVTDKEGITASQSILITVGDDSGSSGGTNNSPSAAIIFPQPYSVYRVGDDVTFIGTANDKEDGPLTGNSLIWTSDKDGQLGTGGSFSTDILSSGIHNVTLTATDANSAKNSATVTIQVLDYGQSIQHCASYNESTEILHIPCVDLGTPYWIDMHALDNDFLMFELSGYGPWFAGSQCATFDIDTFKAYIPCLEKDGTTQWMELKAVDNDFRNYKRVAIGQVN